MSLKDQIRDARRKAGMTQEQAAQLIGVSKSTWAGYETGNSRPDADKIGAILVALGIDANTLFEYEKSPVPEGTEDEKISIEEMKQLLRALGFIGDGRELTEKDVKFLSGVFDMLDAWFSR